MLHRLKSKIQLKTVICMIPTVVFWAFVFYMMINTYTGTVVDTVKETELSLEGFTDLTDSMEDVLQENFYDKYSFIDLNGLTTKLLGINSLNERQLLANGHLARFADESDTTEESNNVIQLNAFLQERGIDFLYLVVPSKCAFYGAEFSPGYGSTAWKSIDSMIESLSASGVNFIDMDAWFEENNWSMDDVYFKTDHHWKPEAALAAVKATVELLTDQGSASYDGITLENDSWSVTVLEDWFLGSSGKRTGALYAGTDDISVYEPNFPVNYTYSGLKRNSTTWKYYDNILDLSYTAAPDYFNDNPYCMYMYEDFAIRTTINTEALNQKRVLIVGDSYKMPYEYFLTTQFQEVYTVDLRYYTDGTLAQYINEINPDIVIMCTCISSLSSDGVYEFGVEEYLSALDNTNQDATEINLGDCEVIAGKQSKNKFNVVCSNLEAGKTYTLTLDSTAYSGGDGLYIQMTLQNLSTGEAVVNRYFDANSEETQTWIFTVPEGESTYAIYLYAGTKGQTENVTVKVTGIRLQEGVLEA